MPEPEQDALGERLSARWFRRIALSLLFVVAVYAVWENYEALAEDLRGLSRWVVVTAFLTGALAMVASLQVWRELMATLGSPLPLGASIRIFYLSQLGKYLPGSVWSVLAQMELGRDFNVPRRTTAAVGVLVLVIPIVAGATLTLALLPLAGTGLASRYWWLVLLVPPMYVVIHPRVLTGLANRVLRLLRRPPMPACPTWRGILRAILFQCATWLLLGVQIWVLLIALGAPPGPSFPVAVAGYALAYVVGKLVVVLPAGVGAREGVLVLALSTVVSASTALLVALLARLILTVVDVVLAGFAAVGTRPKE